MPGPCRATGAVLPKAFPFARFPSIANGELGIVVAAVEKDEVADGAKDTDFTLLSNRFNLWLNASFKSELVDIVRGSNANEQEKNPKNS